MAPPVEHLPLRGGSLSFPSISINYPKKSSNRAEASIHLFSLVVLIFLCTSSRVWIFLSATFFDSDGPPTALLIAAGTHPAVVDLNALWFMEGISYLEHLQHKP